MKTFAPHLARCGSRLAIATAVVAACIAGRWPVPLASQAGQPVVALVGGTIVDGTGAEPFTGTIVIDGDRIAAAGPSVAVPKGATIVDAKGQTIIPGMFDLHTHVTASPAGGDSDWAKNLMAYVYCGITTVSELGSYAENFEAIRRLERAGTPVMPRLQMASRMATPKGHGAESGRPTVHTNEVLTPREADERLTSILAGPRPDLIKVFQDGWRYGVSPAMDDIQADTLKAIVDRAHGANLPVITHTVTVAQARVAAVAGVDMIGHSIGDRDLEPDIVEMVRAKGLTYVPTLAVYEPKTVDVPASLADVLEPAARESLARRAAARSSENSADAQQKRWTTMRRNVALMRAGGARIAVGTDNGMPATFHGWSTLRELKLLVSAGLTPFEAILAATGNAANAVRVDQERGTLTAGKLADVVVVAGRPYEHIEDIDKIRSVYLGGRLVDRDRLKATIASAEPVAFTASAAPERVDDFEQENGRAPGGQLWVDYTDGGHDRTRLIFTRSMRGAGDHALLAFARLAVKDRPFGWLTLPLSGGGLLPVDASGFKAIAFDVRGDGTYRLLADVRGRSASAPLAAPFDAGPGWRHVVLPFADFKGQAVDPAWPKRLLAVAVELTGPAGAKRWIEIDNVGFEGRSAPAAAQDGHPSALRQGDGIREVPAARS